MIDACRYLGRVRWDGRVLPPDQALFDGNRRLIGPQDRPPEGTRPPRMSANAEPDAA